jgi:MHS family shikimate/dehydroshikimate transporter-like MFS transporter
MSNPTSIPRRSLIEAVVASTIGTTIEWYDFFLYGTAAALVFPRVYFPDFEPFTAQILSFGTFAGGFLARPLGGIVFGYMGDRVGRKSALVTTLLLMGISTFLIGFLPSYAEIGVAAPILLTILRFLQGLGVGGEWGGAVLFAMEYGHRGRRGFYASWPQAGVPLGLLLSTGVVALCQGSFGEAEFLASGWRIPFYLSGLLIVVGLLIRLRIMETPLFAALQKENDFSKAPIRETLKRHWREILLVAGARLVENSCFYLFTVFIISYARKVLQVDENVALNAINLAAALELITIPLYGMLSDRFTRRRMYMIGCLLLMLFAWPYYALLETRDPVWIVLATVVVMNFGHAIVYSVQGSLISELFGTRLRCTGASIGYQLASPLAGGLAPIVAAVLMKEFPGQYGLLAAYIIVLAAISMICVHLLAERTRSDLAER